MVPRNGYANRLQAWASARVVAARLGWSLRVLWEPQAVATTPASRLFSRDLISSTFVDSSSVTVTAGCPHEYFPRHLTVLPERDLIVLAGHERGEQAFMAELANTLDVTPSVAKLLIIAGGAFHLPGTTDPEGERRAAYAGIRWSDEIDLLVGQATAERPAFAALHVRQTDRSREAPTERALRTGLRLLRDRVAERSLFICADTPGARAQWAHEAVQLGFEPWSMPDVEFDRGSEDNGVSALVDWLLLSKATGAVHPATSTFSGEAVVAGGTQATSVPLSAGAGLRRIRALRSLGSAVATYPSRRFSS